MTQDKALLARGVSFAYGERQALNGIDFEVAKGSVHGFLGPNGSGKSTLFKILSTLVPPQAGTISVFGLDLAGDPAAIRAKIGVVFQSPAVDRKLTVQENLRYGGQLQGIAGADLKRRIDELLEHAQLDDRRGDRVEELSGGLRRRVEISKALLPRPEMLLLDEASTGLDPSARGDMWKLIEQHEELTVLFTTHLMDEAAHADRLTLLDDGAVVAEGAPEELMQEAGSQVIEIVTDDPASLAAEMQSLHNVDVQVMDRTLRIEGERIHELVPQLFVQGGDRVQRLSLAHPSLEDVFLHKTGKRFVVTEPDTSAGKKKRRRRR